MKCNKNAFSSCNLLAGGLIYPTNARLGLQGCTPACVAKTPGSFIGGVTADFHALFQPTSPPALQPPANRPPSPESRASPTGYRPSAAWPRPRAQRACATLSQRLSGFSRQPPGGGLSLAIKAHCLAGPRRQTGSRVARAREEELHVSFQPAVVAGAEASAAVRPPG